MIFLLRLFLINKLLIFVDSFPHLGVHRSTEVPSTFSIAREIVKKDGFGLRGLNKGLTATIGRNGVFNMIYFGFYHSVRDYFPAYQVLKISLSFCQWIIQQSCITIACFA